MATVRPFGTGTQYEAFVERNCDKCWKFDPDASSDECICPMDRAMGEAMWGDGTMPADLARRMGYPQLAYVDDAHRERFWSWDCPEREADRPPEPGEDVKLRQAGYAMLPGLG